VTVASLPYGLQNVKSFASEKGLNTDKRHIEIIRKRFEGEITKLKRKNNELLSINVKATTLHNEMSLFFVSCVEEIKKNICQRTRLQYCDLADFKKEDKLSVLMAMLSHDDIIAAIHEKLFNR
jgi:hypothetical protein